MKPWSLAAAGLVLAAPLSAQNSAGVSVWLEQTPGVFSPAQAQGADAELRKLLGSNAAKETIAAKDGKGTILHYRSAGWSAKVPSFERRAALATLTAVWGQALRVEETPAPALISGLPPSMERKAPVLDSALALVPRTLLSGDHAGFYDGFKPAGGAVDPVLGRSGSATFLAPSASQPVAAPPKLEPPSPLASPAPPSSPYADLIAKAARESGIDPALLRAVVAAKSGFSAGRVSAGAYGLMGVSARSGKIYGYTPKQLLDPEINLKVGSDMLADLLKQFGGDVHRALAAYQAGPLAVLRSGGIPNDRSVRDFMNEVERELGPEARAASIPVKTIRSPLKYAVQKDLIELAEQARKGSGVSRYRPLIEKMAAQFGVDPKLMEAMVMQEDPSGNPRAVSPAGARGLAQLMPDTASQLGVKNSFDPLQSLRGMARHMKHLSEVFGGDRVLIAAAYNSGEGVVGRLGRVPRYKETMAYVRRVFNNYFALGESKVDVEPYMPPPVKSRRKKAAR